VGRVAAIAELYGVAFATMHLTAAH